MSGFFDGAGLPLACTWKIVSLQAHDAAECPVFFGITFFFFFLTYRKYIFPLFPTFPTVKYLPSRPSERLPRPSEELPGDSSCPCLSTSLLLLARRSELVRNLPGFGTGALCDEFPACATVWARRRPCCPPPAALPAGFWDSMFFGTFSRYI